MKIKKLNNNTYEIMSSELYLFDDKAILEYFNNINVDVIIFGNGMSSTLIQRNKRFNFSSIDRIIIKKNKIIEIKDFFTNLDINKGDDYYFKKHNI